METLISRRIVRGYMEKLERCLDVDVAIVGAGPSGLLCAHDLARAGRRVAVFERHLKAGGGAWGGGMLFNEVAVQDSALPILDELGIRHSEAAEKLATADSVEMAAALVYHAVHVGADLFNAVTVEDVVVREGRVTGIVANWSPVLDQHLHVDPLAVRARVVLDATGHDAGLTAKVAGKARIELETETGGILGERPMWAEEAERATVDNTRRVFPGLYVAGMAANGVFGSFRMGPVFGGMLRSGRRAATLILDELGADASS